MLPIEVATEQLHQTVYRFDFKKKARIKSICLTLYKMCLQKAILKILISLFGVLQCFFLRLLALFWLFLICLISYMTIVSCLFYFIYDDLVLSVLLHL